MTVDSPRSRRSRTRKRVRRNEKRRRLKMESLECRRLLAVGGGAIPATLDSEFFNFATPRNIGAVQAFQAFEQEASSAFGVNDTVGSAQFVPLGTRPEDESTIDILGSMGVTFGSQNNVQTDIDMYAFDLRAGDILDLAVQGAGANLTVFDPRGRIWFATGTNTALGSYPDGSPLMTTGNAVAAQVVPEDGRYYAALAPTFTSLNYTLGLRAYRPVLESAPIGAQQIIYLDFDGGVYATSDFPGSTLGLGIVQIESLENSLDVLGYVNPLPGDADLVIDSTVDRVVQQLRTVAEDGSPGSGTNGDWLTSGIPGEYGITVLNSRDHADPGNNPYVTRVIIGSVVTTGQPADLFGTAQTLDVGNFRPNEKVLVLLEQNSTAGSSYPRSPSATQIDAVAQQLSGTITHEVAHSFGMRHTDGGNATETLTDEGSQSLDDFVQGIGNDGIFGTSDDIVPYFGDDRFSPTEAAFFGTQRFAAAMSHVLSTGTVGSSVTGRVFNDLNRDGSGAGDPGYGGVRMFADVDLDGVMDPSEPNAVTNANGVFTLSVAPGTQYNIIAMTPAQYAPTIPNVRFATGGATGVDFGFYKVVPDVTGTKFADVNGNGVFDSTESGLAGVYVYLDLDGDDRPDLGEPSAVTDANGNYSIDFPGPGTYTLREVVGPGFIQTFPQSGEHVVVYNGSALTENYNFGNLPSRDYGDAPDTYRTSVAAGGPSHGTNVGFGLGPEVDREVNGFPSPDALGDDNNGIDDEDGVQLLSPLGPGGTATLAVTTRNSINELGYLQGWMDFDQSGTFEANEKVFSDVILQAGTSNLQVNVPATAAIGSTFARFRYSPTAGLGVGGEADMGEVEDYQFDILQQAAVANDDEFTVSRNSLANVLDVLANDFESNLTQLTIIQLNTAGTEGSVGITQGGRAISYTPRNGFTGRDVFQYVVRDQNNNRYTANVVVNVNFQSNVPIAVDDIFEIPQGSSNRALNVLDNDVPSIAGGLRIISVSAGDQGGQVSLEGGGQTIRYTPQPGFAGTEQFTYSIEDANGSVSTAEVTVNSIPGARNDDRVEFSIGIFDPINTDRELSSVQVGQTFNVKVFVDEINAPDTLEGVASAFLDLLYTDELVSTVDTINNDNFPFDITFGELFQGSGFALGDATTPGLINDVGALQRIVGSNVTPHSGPVELFTLTMAAVSPGAAVFAGDPADAVDAETILFGEDTALTPAQQRLGTAELTIFPASDNFSSAIDDAFVAGVDSNGAVINGINAPNTLDVLANDNRGPSGRIREFGIATGASLGTVMINNNGTPSDPNDDTVDYFANVGAQGFDSFTYVIVSEEGVRSTAEVTLAIGDAAADDQVDITYRLVDEAGNPIQSVASGQTFGVQVYVDSLVDGRVVFAAYMDVLYDNDLITPASPIPGNDPNSGRYDFRVAFDSDFERTAGVGTALRSGVIDEFGAFLTEAAFQSGSVIEPNLMATLFFTADFVQQSTPTEVIASPADSSPAQDTLLLNVDDPIPVSRINYDVLNFTITAGSALHNAALPEDVNDDGFVTPSDALKVINSLARSDAGEGEATRQSLYFTDVNGDFKTTPLDALRVINRLVWSSVGGGEAEQAVAAVLPPTSSDAGEDTAVDAALSELNGNEKVVGSDVVGGEVAPKAVTATTPFAVEDDDDDLLTLLADDQSGLA